MRVVRVLALALPMFAACGSDDDAGDAAGVFPEEGFLGRKITVEVTGDGTAWDAGSTVNFGDGVTVGAITVVSPQALQVDLTVAPDAPAGAHDVTVTDGGDTFALTGAFTLKSPVSVEALAPFEQGGFGLITVTNLDLLNPFDESTDPNTGDFTAVEAVGTDPAVALTVVNVTSDTVTLSATIDVNATTTGDITVTSNTGGVATVSKVAPVAVTARTPQVVAVGTTATFTVQPNGSLLEITAASAGLLHIEMIGDGNEFLPGFILLPASGKFGDILDQHVNFFGRAALDNRVVAAGDKFFMVALEFAGDPGYMATFDARIVDLTGVTAVADNGTNDTPDAAQQLTGLVAEFDGTLADANDSDCFKITTAAVNQRIHVFTTDENGTSDTLVDVFDGSLAASTSIATSDDADFGEDVITGNLAATISRSICVTPSSAAPEGFTNAPYKAFVVIEPPAT